MQHTNPAPQTECWVLEKGRDGLRPEHKSGCHNAWASCPALTLPSHTFKSSCGRQFLVRKAIFQHYYWPKLSIYSRLDTRHTSRAAPLSVHGHREQARGYKDEIRAGRIPLGPGISFCSVHRSPVPTPSVLFLTLLSAALNILSQFRQSLSRFMVVPLQTLCS